MVEWMVTSTSYLRSGEDPGVVHRRHVGVEQAEVTLGQRAWLEVLVEEGEDGHLEGAA